MRETNSRPDEGGEPIDRLSDLGFDGWFEEKNKTVPGTGDALARVTVVHRSSYLVRNEKNEVPAEPAGKFLFNAESNRDLPVVGDWVRVQYHNADSFAIIHDLLPRKTLLQRKTPGKEIDFQLIAANIDVAFIVQACDSDFSLRRLERYLVMIHDGGIDPAILLTKSDLIDAEELQRKTESIEQLHIPCDLIALSNLTGFGLDRVRRKLEKGKTYCLLGSSGVGKTTLLNHLLGEDLFATQSIRPADDKGRHTTARRQLIVLENGAMVIDTPGMRELGNMSTVDGVEDTFADIHELAGSCRFTDCTHLTEPGCALITATVDGRLDEGRYKSYLKLLRESEHNRMSYVEKRRRDKAFGKFIKLVLKENIKRK